MRKDDAIKVIVMCAKEYSANLAGQNLLIIFGGEIVEYFEAVFLPQNFMHLTGVIPLDKSLSSVAFYNACIGGKLTPSLFEMNRDGTTRMKLSVLPQIMNIHKTARMVGDFSQNKIRLNTEKVAVNVHGCMGFVTAKQHQGFYVSNTVLREDIRDVVEKPTRRVLAIFRKQKDLQMYTECTYLAKGVSLASLLVDDRLKEKIVLQ